MAEQEHTTPEPEIGGYEFAAQVTGIRRTTLYSLVCEKRIPHIRLSGRMVRFRRADLETWLASHAVSESKR